MHAFILSLDSIPWNLTLIYIGGGIGEHNPVASFSNLIHFKFLPGISQPSLFRNYVCTIHVNDVVIVGMSDAG